MPKITAYKCDGCDKIITDERDVYRLELRGARWMQPDAAGGPSEPMRRVKELGFCERCATSILQSLKKIAERSG